MPYLVSSDWTTKNIRVKAEPVASATLGLRLALNATARACAEERAGIAGLITSLTNVLTYCGRASGTPRRALDSAQGKPCSVALLGLAFTMAEILLSLTIIGVVAAITLPSLTGNINERTWNTQRKALYARFSQAIALMPSLNGYAGTETFVTDGLAKVLKINNICDSEHFEDCGIASKWTDFSGSNISSIPNTLYTLNSAFDYSSTFVDSNGNTYSHSVTVPDTEAAAFETVNGESIIVYYNPQCTSDLSIQLGGTTNYVQKSMCANFIYDLNGSKGPNTIGKDIGFITAMYPSDSNVVAVSPLGSLSDAAGNHSAASGLCRIQYGDSSRAPNYDEGASIFINKKFIGIANSNTIWTTTTCAPDKAWRINILIGYRNCFDVSNEKMQFYCIRRSD